MRNDIVKQAENIKAVTENRIHDLKRIGTEQMYLYCSNTSNPPTADCGVFADNVEPWEVGKEYKANDLFSYNGALGYVKQAHTSQETWLPFTQGTESLYGSRPAPNEDGIYPYTYNMAATLGMLVLDPDDNLVYECIQTIADMLWKPHEIPAHFKSIAYVVEDTDTEDYTVAEWVQPTGSHNAYSSGDIVSYNNEVWVSTADNNVWKPGEYGWEVL